MALANTMEVWLFILGHVCTVCQKGKQIPQAFYLHRHSYSESSELHRHCTGNRKNILGEKKKKRWQENGAEIYIEFLLSKGAHILVP